MQLRLWALGILACLCADLRGADRTPSGWQTGAELQASLAATISVTWDRTPLEQALEALGAADRVAIVRDRRLDPNQPIKLTLTRQSLRAALEQIAEHLKAGYCQFGPVAYLGPSSTAKRLRTVAALRQEEAKKLPGPVSRKLLASRGWQWPEASEPRALVEQLAKEAGLTLRGADRIPYDLWLAGDWPAMTWIDRLTLVAAEFDLTFRFVDEGQAVELVPMPADVSIVRTYRGGSQAAALAKRWANDVPQARIAVEGERIRLAGRIEDHELIEARLKPKSAARRTASAGEQVHQLHVEMMALDKLVGQLAERLNLEVAWDRAAIEAAGIRTDQLVSVDASDARLDDLLTAVFRDTGLTFERDAQQVRIAPRR